MNKKPVLLTEIAYAIGILTLAFGTALMERADLGISMVVAPAYLIHLKVSQALPFYSFGMSEYVFQAALLIALSLIARRFKRAYLFSFVTAVIYGFTLDLMMSLAAFIPMDALAVRIAVYAAGFVICAVGVALFFNAYIPPEAYELFVKELSSMLGRDVSRVKTVYDIISCAVGVALSFIFFGLWRFEGVKLGTIICAILNGPLIGIVSKGLNSVFSFRDGLPKLKAFFEK
ncbi:MAG: hypothetical protein IKG85_05855 [Clostridia bacterium]|nr:hypothetical protein [Clostridia bacterium]